MTDPLFAATASAPEVLPEADRRDEVDAALVERVRAGDPDAFAQLYAAHSGAVWHAVRDNLRDRDAIADAVQETFLRALARLGSVRDPRLFRPWLLAIARHTAVDQRRRMDRERPSEDQVFAEVPAADRGPDESAELAELARLVHGALATLTPRDATVVGLVTHLGCSSAEVAAALGVSVGAAKVTVHRARRRLRTALALTLLSGNPGSGCARFRTLHGEGEIVQAGRHLQDCAACIVAAGDEVELFGAAEQPAPSPPGQRSRPSTRIGAARTASANAAGRVLGSHPTVPKPATSSPVTSSSR